MKHTVELSRHSSPGTDGRFLSQKLVVNGRAGTSWGREEMVPPQGLPHHMSGEVANVPTRLGRSQVFPEDQTGWGRRVTPVKHIYSVIPNSHRTVKVELLVPGRRSYLA